eukprot:scaffold42439_cov37-Phaeocystis_antarctica.AAC.1
MIRKRFIVQARPSSSKPQALVVQTRLSGEALGTVFLLRSLSTGHRGGRGGRQTTPASGYKWPQTTTTQPKALLRLCARKLGRRHRNCIAELLLAQEDERGDRHARVHEQHAAADAAHEAVPARDLHGREVRCGQHVRHEVEQGRGLLRAEREGAQPLGDLDELEEEVLEVLGVGQAAGELREPLDEGLELAARAARQLLELGGGSRRARLQPGRLERGLHGTEHDGVEPRVGHVALQVAQRRGELRVELEPRGGRGPGLEEQRGEGLPVGEGEEEHAPLLCLEQMQAQEGDVHVPARGLGL